MTYVPNIQVDNMVEVAIRDNNLTYIPNIQVENMIEIVIREHDRKHNINRQIDPYNPCYNSYSLTKNMIIESTAESLFPLLQTNRILYIDALQKDFEKKIAEIFTDMYQSNKIDFNFPANRYYVCYKEESMYPTLRSDYEHNR